MAYIPHLASFSATRVNTGLIIFAFLFLLSALSFYNICHPQKSLFPTFIISFIFVLLSFLNILDVYLGEVYLILILRLYLCPDLCSIFLFPVIWQLLTVSFRSLSCSWISTRRLLIKYFAFYLKFPSTSRSQYTLLWVKQTRGHF